MRIEHSLDITAAPDRVFALTVDIERWPSLMPTVTAVERLDTGQLKVGSRARLKQPGQKPTVWAVTEIVAPERFVWNAKVLGMNMVASHIISATATGCRNTLVLDLSGRGSGLLGVLLRRKLRSVLVIENDCFRQAAED